MKKMKWKSKVQNKKGKVLCILKQLEMFPHFPSGFVTFVSLLSLLPRENIKINEKKQLMKTWTKEWKIYDEFYGMLNAFALL